MDKRVTDSLLVDDIDEANKYQDILNKIFNSIENCDDKYFSWESITYQDGLYSKLVNYGNSSLLKVSGFKVFNLSTLQLEDISITEVKSSEMDSTFLNIGMNIEIFETDLSCMGICLNNHYVDRLVYMALLNSSAYPVIHNRKVIKPNKNKYSLDSLNMSILRLRLQICGDFGFSAGIEILIDLDKNKYCVYSLDKFCTGDRTVNDVPSIYNIRIQLSKIDCNLGYVEFIGDYCKGGNTMTYFNMEGDWEENIIIYYDIETGEFAVAKDEETLGGNLSEELYGVGAFGHDIYGFYRIVYDESIGNNELAGDNIISKVGDYVYLYDGGSKCIVDLSHIKDDSTIILPDEVIDVTFRLDEVELNNNVKVVLPPSSKSLRARRTDPDRLTVLASRKSDLKCVLHDKEIKLHTNNLDDIKSEYLKHCLSIEFY